MFSNNIKEIRKFLSNYFHSEYFEIIPINNSASNRKYFRIKTILKSYILTYNDNIEENKTFLYFSKIFKENNLHVPEIFKISSNFKIYLQEDIGDTSLITMLLEQGESAEVKQLYQASLLQLIKLQYTTQNIDYTYCYDFSKFDSTLILNDLNYFKFYFFQPLEIPYSNKELLLEFNLLANKISNLAPTGFVYRDFQSRNIFIKDNTPYFIDYQGGIEGNCLYDLVSLLWQAKAQLTDSFKNELKDYYFQEVQKQIQITTPELEEAYTYNLLIRLLQVLGAYGYRGILQKKQHFIESITFAIKNLNDFKSNKILNSYPELQRIIQEITNNNNQEKIKSLLV